MVCFGTSSDLLAGGASFRHARSAKFPRVRGLSSDLVGIDPRLVVSTRLVPQRRWSLRMAKNRCVGWAL